MQKTKKYCSMHEINYLCIFLNCFLSSFLSHFVYRDSHDGNSALCQERTDLMLFFNKTIKQLNLFQRWRITNTVTAEENF